MKYEKWTVAPPDPAALAALEEAGISPLLAAVLSARGIRAPQEARALLEGGETALEDPLALKDMAQAAGRVRLALERGETIAVYGDYDVDGITATCLLTDFLRRKGGAVIPYIPDRLEEGYGLNREAVTALKEQGASYRAAGENIAYGQRSAEQVMEGWMNSSGHRANILNAQYTAIGVGVYRSASGTLHWVQLFIG